MVFGTVVRTFVCALFGAIFGYILGDAIELFPGLNMALQNGLHDITGMSVVSMPSLLATIGLMAGVILGVVISVLIYYAWEGKYSKFVHNWTYGFGHSYWQGHPHARRYRHYRGSVCEPLYDPIEHSLSEIDGYVSYLEDMPGDRLEECSEGISRLNERLSDLKMSLSKNRSS